MKEDSMNNKSKAAPQKGAASAVERLVMPDLFREKINQFTKGVAATQEELAKKIIDAGYSPDQITIGYKTWYDEKTFTMHHECWPIFKKA